MNHDVLWRIIAFALGAQVAAFVGLFQISDADPALYILLGISTAGIGILGPLTTRNVETVILLDRLRLDEYEAALLSENPNFRLYHAERMQRRISIWSRSVPAEGMARLSERRFGSFKWAAHLNRVLDAVGQPTLVWVAAMGLAGAVGFDIGIFRGVNNELLAWSLCIGTNVFMSVLWLLATGLLWQGRNRRGKCVLSADASTQAAG